MENTQYKGFAYTKEGNKPTVVYGMSAKDILAKLNSYNIARTEKDKFSACNIGRLNEETSKYENYHRYEVATGKDITAVYLTIPPLNRDKFREVTADLRAAGAKFNPKKKMWYITDWEAEDLQALQTYLDSFGTNAKANKAAGIRMPEEKTVLPDSLLDSVRRSVEEELEKPDFMIEGLEIQYAVKMQNQQTVIIPESTLNKMWSQEGIRGSYNEFFDELNEKALEQLQAQDIPDPARIADESEYIISVDKQRHENKCTVWFNDGREPIEINGYEHDVLFPGMDAGEAADFVAGYLKNMEQPDRSIRLEYHEGDAIDCYVPFRLQNISPDQPIYIENVSHIAGHVRSVETLVGTDVKAYEILQEDGNVRTIRSDEIYAPDQARVLLRAAADELTGVQFDLLADRKLSAAQMEEIRFGFKDGMSAEKVALYANPNMTPAEMDMCRIGLNSGLDYAEISRLLKETKELSWTDSRNRLNEAIKNHRVIEETRKAAHEAGLPFSENMTSEEMNPYVYDGSMSAEDYKQMLNRMEESASEPTQGAAAEMPVEEKGLEIYGSAPADFYGKQVPVENGKRVISQETMDGLLQHIAEMGIELEPLDFTNCIFREVNFQDRAYRTEVFHDTDFSGSEFYHCRFYADMRRSSFRATSFTETTFRTVLNQCDFSRSRIANCNFQDSNMVDVNFSEAYLKRTRFSGCALENDDFYKSQMDMVDVLESCGVIDSKHFDTISTENMSDRVLWRLSGISDVSYERKEELQKLFQGEKEGRLDSEDENWRQGLIRDEEELVDKWDKQYTKAMEEKSSSTKAAPEKEKDHDKTYGGKRSVVNLLHEKKSMVSTSAVENAHEDKIRKAEVLTK